MICLRCDSERFREKDDAHIVQEFKGATVTVITPAMECVKCGWLTLTTDQLGELVKRTYASLGIDRTEAASTSGAGTL